MNRLPAKQIYLLTIIILGITSLSVYSTYSIFTLESETSDIVSIQTSNVLNVETETYEYKQISIAGSSSMTTDVDIYNNFDYNLCYSVWYKVVSSKGINTGRVSVYQENDTLTTSGILDPVTSRRIKITINNKNEDIVKVNIGVAYSKNSGTCALNISNDKSLITTTEDNTKVLYDVVMKDTKEKESPSNYITYQNNTNEINLMEYEKVYISKKYTYKDEIFTLTDPEEIQISDIDKYNDNYTCLSNKTCRNLYHINASSNEDEIYKITKYDTLVGYLSGKSGVRKVNQNYYYYGDNPNNFVYYNCTSDKNTSTCELWRIIGVFYDATNNKYATKIIKNDTIGSLKYSTTDNTWNNSNVLKTLKEYKITDDSVLEEVEYKQEVINNNNITKSNTVSKTNIMLMNITDVLNTSICTDKKITEFDTNCLNNNWINRNYKEEWTMTNMYEEPYIDEETEETIIPDNNKVYSIGTSIQGSLIDSTYAIRPVVYLTDSVIVTGGNGTYEKPYIIR